MARLFKTMDETGLSRLRSLEETMGDNVRLIALEKRPNLANLKSRPPAFQDLERDLDATLLVYFGADSSWR
jgi:hypothetical protein